MLPSTNPRITYMGNNSTGTYPWTWLVYQDTDLHIAVLSNASPQVLTVLALGTDYTIQNENLQIGNSNGGNIVLTSSGFFAFNNGVLPTGWVLVIRRAVVFEQDTTLNSQGLYDPASIEGTLDFLTMQTIQLQDAIAHCVQMPLDDASIPAQNVPVAATRAGQYSAFDGNGNPISIPGPLSGVVANTYGGQIAQNATQLGAEIAQSANTADILQYMGIAGLLPFVPIQMSSTIGSTSNYVMEFSPFGPQKYGAIQGGTIILFVCPITNVGLTSFTFGSNTMNVLTPAGAGLSNGALVEGSVYMLAAVDSTWVLLT